MKLMGMKGWLHWSASYFKFFVFMLISVAIMTILFHMKVAGDRAVMNYTDPSVTFVFLLLFSLSVMTLCFLLSTFFSEEGMSCIVFSESMSCIVWLHGCLQNSIAYIHRARKKWNHSIFAPDFV